MIKQATKKQITIDYIQYDGANFIEIQTFTGGTAFKPGGKSDVFMIPTLEGDMQATTGDYIIKGVKGEFYPCKPDIFEASYDFTPEKVYDTAEYSSSNASKTLGNTTASQAKDNVKDIVFWGNGDLFKLIGKASSKNEGWMKSTKAMCIEGIGAVVQVTTQQGQHVADAVTFVPGVKMQENVDTEGKVISRELVKM